MFKQDNRYIFYEEQYYKEIERKDKFNTRIGTALSILTLLIAGAFYMFSNHNDIHIIGLHYLYYCFATLTGIAICIAIYTLIKAYFGYKYKALPSIRTIKNYEDDLKIFYQEKGFSGELLRGKVNDRLKLFLIKQYINNTEVNIELNVAKDDLLRFNAYAIQGAVVLLIFSFLCFVPGFIVQKDPVQKVIIVNKDEPNYHIIDRLIVNKGDKD